jgi:hypothetical protein
MMLNNQKFSQAEFPAIQRFTEKEWVTFSGCSATFRESGREGNFLCEVRQELWICIA